MILEAILAIIGAGTMAGAALVGTEIKRWQTMNDARKDLEKYNKNYEEYCWNMMKDFQRNNPGWWVPPRLPTFEEYLAGRGMSYDQYRALIERASGKRFY